MDMDAKIFAEMMKINITLEKLDLSYNSFGAHGGIYLGGGLVCCYSSVIVHCDSLMTLIFLVCELYIESLRSQIQLYHTERWCCISYSFKGTKWVIQ